MSLEHNMIELLLDHAVYDLTCALHNKNTISDIVAFLCF
jgi:hypothetical protein